MSLESGRFNRGPQTVEGRDLLDTRIEAETMRLAANIEKLRGKDIPTAEDIERSSGKEGINRLAAGIQKVAIGMGALLTIPFVASVVSPDILPQVQEWAHMTQETLLAHGGEVVAGVGALTAIFAGSLFTKIYRDYAEYKKLKNSGSTELSFDEFVGTKREA